MEAATESGSGDGSEREDADLKTRPPYSWVANHACRTCPFLTSSPLLRRRYSQLAVLALEDLGRAKVHEIYGWIQSHFPYYNVGAQYWKVQFAQLDLL